MLISGEKGEEMKKYLIFANTGGEMESPKCSYMHYHICEGNSIREAIDDWRNKVDQYMNTIVKNWAEEKRKHTEYMQRIIENYQEITEEDGLWYDGGRLLQIVELRDNEGYNCWHSLKWY
jgi:hypothetical protein